MRRRDAKGQTLGTVTKGARDEETACEENSSGGRNRRSGNQRDHEGAGPGSWVGSEFGVGSAPQRYIILERLNRVTTGKKLLHVTTKRPLGILEHFQQNKEGISGAGGKEPACPLQETQETWVQSLGMEDPLMVGVTTRSSILAWRIPWTVHEQSDTTEVTQPHLSRVM